MFTFRLTYFKDPFEIFMGPNTMVEFYVVEEEEIDDFHRGVGHGAVSTKHQLSHVWVSRASEVGAPDAPIYSVRTHLGRTLRVGDSVMGGRNYIFIMTIFMFRLRFDQYKCKQFAF